MYQTLKANLVPTISNGIIEGKVEGYSYFFNPLGHKGVLVLFGEALEVFNSCRAKLSLAEMKKTLPWARSNQQQVDQIIDALGKSKLINLGKDYSEKLRAEHQGATKKVMTVWFQLTDACNLRCEYCCISQKPTRMGLEVAKKLVEKIAIDSEKAGFKEVLIKIAGGEPTLFWIDAKALIDWADNRFTNPKLKVRFHIITNGTLITQSLIDYVCQDRVGVSVSLDGVGKWHDVQRPYVSGMGSFDKVNTNINKLLAAGIHPNILAVITKKNAGGTTELAKYCTERDLAFRFGFYRDNPTSSNELDNDNAELIKELMTCYAWIADNLPAKSIRNYD
ncbi:MAG: radical SAM protein [bacterium]|nr:radical SAM protein [bacterium]